MRLNSREVETLTKNANQQVGEGEHKHDAPSKEYLGQDAAVLARGAGKSGVRIKVELLFGETELSNPFVPVEQMMPFVPFVRCRDVNEAIDREKEAEHGFRHTSLIHSNNVQNMTHMGRVLDTTLFVKNGPCMASLGWAARDTCRFRSPGRPAKGDHAAHVHPRAALFADRRFVHPGQAAARPSPRFPGVGETAAAEER